MSSQIAQQPSLTCVWVEQSELVRTTIILYHGISFFSERFQCISFSVEEKQTWLNTADMLFGLLNLFWGLVQSRRIMADLKRFIVALGHLCVYVVCVFVSIVEL